MALAHFLEMARNAQDRIPEGNYVRVTTKYSSGDPGCDRLFSPETAAVTVSVGVSKLTTCLSGRQKILDVAGPDRYDSKTQVISFTVNAFPFRSQNRQRAMQILKDLKKEAEIPYTSPQEEMIQEEKATAKKKQRPCLGFPTEWLKGSVRRRLESRALAS